MSSHIQDVLLLGVVHPLRHMMGTVVREEQVAEMLA